MVIKQPHTGVATVALAAVAMVSVAERQAAVVALMAGMVRVPAATGQGLAEPGRELQRESSEKPPVIYMPVVVAAVALMEIPFAPVARVAAVMAGHKATVILLDRLVLIILAAVAAVDTPHKIATEGAGL